MDRAYHGFFAESILPRRAETRSVPSLGAHALFRSENDRWLRRHARPRRCGVRSRLWGDRKNAGAAFLSAHVADDVRISQASAGATLREMALSHPTQIRCSSVPLCWNVLFFS